MHTNNNHSVCFFLLCLLPFTFCSHLKQWTVLWYYVCVFVVAIVDDVDDDDDLNIVHESRVCVCVYVVLYKTMRVIHHYLLCLLFFVFCVCVCVCVRRLNTMGHDWRLACYGKVEDIFPFHVHASLALRICTIHIMNTTTCHVRPYYNNVICASASRWMDWIRTDGNAVNREIISARLSPSLFNSSSVFEYDALDLLLFFVFVFLHLHLTSFVMKINFLLINDSIHHRVSECVCCVYHYLVVYIIVWAKTLHVWSRDD